MASRGGRTQVTHQGWMYFRQLTFEWHWWPPGEAGRKQFNYADTFTTFHLYRF